MSQHILDALRARGFIKQTVYEDDLRAKLAEGSTAFYTGFDPTADSLHIGHYIPLAAMRHMQLAGHKPYILIGGATALIGDPSGRSDLRSMMTRETVDRNVAAFKKQMARFLSFEGENAAVIVNNADWLLPLNYVAFIRDIGVHFSVNQMLSAECFKQRLEKGLSFLEFNYMLMQAYDFLHLYEAHGIQLQLGGDDQWSNILAGANLIRVKNRQPAYAMTFSLLTTSDGKKMGKTQKGALWLDADKTSPYDFYQYFRNVDDADVDKCLKLLTFLSVPEIEALTCHQDQRINAAKERLAFEVTRIIHGEAAATEAQRQAKAAFSGDSGNMPSAQVGRSLGRRVADILVAAGIAASRGEAKRLIEGGGVSVEDLSVKDIAFEVPDALYSTGSFVLHKGKKTHVRIELT